jgi:hypothetical protein
LFGHLKKVVRVVLIIRDKEGDALGELMTQLRSVIRPEKSFQRYPEKHVPDVGSV